MKRIISYILISILVLAVAFFPRGNEKIATPHTEEAKSEENFGEIVPAEPSIAEPGSTEPSSTEPSFEAKPETPSTQETLKPKETKKAATDNTDKGEVRISDKVHKEIPNQSEDTTVAGADVLKTIKQKVISSKGYPGSYSNDCQNVAIMRANGNVQSAGAILASYGNSVSWYECSAYDYCAGFAENELNDLVNKICQNLKMSSLDNYGIGIKVSQEQGYYKVKVVVVFTN